jgi:hypothetical protein
VVQIFGKGAKKGIMLPDIYEDMLKKLMRRTMRGEVHWKLSSRGDRFIVNFHAFSLAMSRSSNFIQFTIADANDKGIDDFRITNTDKDWDQVSAFYNQIRVKSPDINKAIEAIMEELERKKFVGRRDVEEEEEPHKKLYRLVSQK